jgi:hypothetical protein
MATASDAIGNSSSASVTVTINNVGPGTINGVCMKGAVEGGTAIAYRFAGGVKGAPIGSTATTDMNGTFRIMGVEDYSGPLLITCGGPGSYEEEAFVFTTEMTARDQMRTVIPDFASNSANVTLTPFTALAVVRLEYLLGKGVAFAQAYTQAYRENR